MAIIVMGNAVEGLNFVGPFADVDAAIKWAEDNDVEEWHAVELAKPAEFEAEEAFHG